MIHWRLTTPSPEVRSSRSTVDGHFSARAARSLPDRGRCVPATELEHGPADNRSHIWAVAKPRETKQQAIAYSTASRHQTSDPTLLITTSSLDHMAIC